MYFSNHYSYEVASLLKLTRKIKLWWWLYLDPLFLAQRVTKMDYFLEKMTIFASCISSEPLTVWSRATTHLNQETQVMEEV